MIHQAYESLFSGEGTKLRSPLAGLAKHSSGSPLPHLRRGWSTRSHSTESSYGTTCTPPAETFCRIQSEGERQKQNARNDQRKEQESQVVTLYQQLLEQLQQAVACAREKGASSWLSALPIAEHGFALHKGAFRDVLCLRYGWHPGHLPTECACGRRFTVDHALSCPCGGFQSLRHNGIRDVTADLLNEICHNVSTELELQPLSGESLIPRTANSQDGARLDVKAQGFWRERPASMLIF